VSLVCSDPIFSMLFPKREICDINDIWEDAAADELFHLTTQEGKRTVEREKV
jgi:hypothetical protein